MVGRKTSVFVIIRSESFSDFATPDTESPLVAYPKPRLFFGGTYVRRETDQLQVASGSFPAGVVVSASRLPSNLNSSPLTPHLVERLDSDFTESRVAEDPTSN
jgi:hypothetical protein